MESGDHLTALALRCSFLAATENACIALRYGLFYVALRNILRSV